MILTKQQRGRNMSECQRCKSDRVFTVGAKGSDRHSGSFKGEEFDGYMPSGLNLGGGDYLELDICLECGQAQGQWPVHDPDFEDC
jgi:hypothetical protein